MLKVAFVDISNLARSQIAAAICKKLAPDIFEVYSVGKELKSIDKNIKKIMKEIYDIDMDKNQYTKLISEIPKVDIIVSTGGETFLDNSRKFDEKFKLKDIDGKNEDELKEIIFNIEEKVIKFIKKYEKYERANHTFEPIYDENSRILILGSFPSVKSREQSFYYGHPRNRFWEVVSKITKTELPHNIDEKKSMLLKNNIAIWDVIKSCIIKGSSDSSIKDVEVNDINTIIKNSKVEKLYANGDKAFKLYNKYCENDIGIEIEKLPSTSPANAAYSMEKLIDEWKIIK